MKANESKQIILIGQNRSGTKWLSNILSNHDDIISVRYERGGGIQETNMFDMFPMAFGDLSYTDNYIALIECWSNTDFFKIAKADKELFYRLQPRPVNYFEIFKILMDDLAVRNKKKLWLQKTGPKNGMNCLRNYSDGHFIVIKRNISDTLRSNIQLRLNRGDKKKRIIKEVFFYCYHEKLLNEILKNRSVVFVSYGDLKKNPEGEVSRICNLIGLEYDKRMLDVPFYKNTSFKSDSERRKSLNENDMKQIKWISSLFKVLPLFCYSFTHNLLKSKTPRIFPGTFGYIKDKYGID